MYDASSCALEASLAAFAFTHHVEHWGATMKITVLLIIFAVVAAVRGLAMLLAPEPYMFPYGASANAQATLLLRYCGALFCGLAVIAWMARNLKGPSLSPILVGFAVSAGACAVVTAAMVLCGLYNVALWIAVGLQAAFAFGFVLALRRN